MAMPSQKFAWYPGFIMLKPSVCSMEYCLICCIWIEMWPSLCPCGYKSPLSMWWRLLANYIWPPLHWKPPPASFFQNGAWTSTTGYHIIGLKRGVQLYPQLWTHEIHIAEWEWEPFSDTHQFKPLAMSWVLSIHQGWNHKIENQFYLP